MECRVFHLNAQGNIAALCVGLYNDRCLSPAAVHVNGCIRIILLEHPIHESGQIHKICFAAVILCSHGQDHVFLRGVDALLVNTVPEERLVLAEQNVRFQIFQGDLVQLRGVPYLKKMQI